MPKRKFNANPQSVDGDFYVVNEKCLACGVFEKVAPDLIAWAVEQKGAHCIWKKQPETPAELAHAFAAFEASDIGCYRYAGTDPSIIERLGREYCDHAPPVPALPRHFPPPEFRPTLVDGDHGFTRKFLAALCVTAVVLLLWLAATRN